MADAVLNDLEQKQEHQKPGKDVKTILWLHYLIASAPFIGVESKQNVQWIMNKGDLDYWVKERVLMRLSPALILDKKLTKTFQMDSREALSIYLAANAGILAQFRKEVIPDLETVISMFETEFFKTQKTKPDSHDGRLLFFNRLNLKERRAAKAESIVANMEGNFVELLIQCHPSQAASVKRYLRMAGYSDREMPGLLNRTIGRIPRTAYLYKGFSAPKAQPSPQTEQPSQPDHARQIQNLID